MNVNLQLTVIPYCKKIGHYINIEMEIIPNFVSINWHLNELKVNLDDNTCKLIHKKCH